MSELLVCKNLTKKYGNVVALDDVNITLESGRIVGLLGPNGSGKTTLIKILNGLLTPTEGRVLIDSEIPGTETKKIVAYLPDNIYLNTWMTVKQIVDYFKDFYPRRAITSSPPSSITITPTRPCSSPPISSRILSRYSTRSCSSRTGACCCKRASMPSARKTVRASTSCSGRCSNGKETI